MASSPKPYKLVPLKIYQDLVTSKDSTSTNNTNSSNSTTPRTIGDIQENTLKEMIKNNQGNKNSNDLALPPLEKQMDMNLGSGPTPKNLVWTHQDQYQLPQFSSQSKIENAFDKYKSILNSDELSETMKLKLMEVFKNKYDKTRQDSSRTLYSGDEDDDEDPYGHYSGPQLAVALLLSKTGLSKMSLVKKMTDELQQHKKHFNWDFNGTITHPPKYRRSPHINLSKMVNVLTVKNNKPTPTELAIITNIVRPFYQKIRAHVKNKDILKQFNLWDIYNRQASSSRRQATSSTSTYQTL